MPPKIIAGLLLLAVGLFLCAVAAASRNRNELPDYQRRRYRVRLWLGVILTAAGFLSIITTLISR